MLLVGGKKMAKSLGNFYTLRDLLDKGFSGIAVRYLLMSAHYRAQLNFSEEALRDAERSLETLRSTVRRLHDLHPQSRRNNIELRKVLSSQKMAFEKAMDDDLNTPRALAALHKIARAVNRAIEQGAVSQADAIAALKVTSQLDRVFGILAEKAETGALSDEAQRKIKQREEARTRRDWAAADRLRAELLAMGVVIEDTPTGTVWKTKPR
jgi:cysteinyl-tRNA synthetase